MRRRMAGMSEKLSPAAQTARALIALAAISHLVFTYIQTRALLLLEDEICGFIMFAFVLLGLVSLFEASQIKPEKRVPMLLTAFFSLATTGMSLLLTSIYRRAIGTQRQLNVAVVNRAVVFSHVLAAVFAAAAVLLIIAFIRKGKKKTDG